jgi:hypothetical protein
MDNKVLKEIILDIMDLNGVVTSHRVSPDMLVKDLKEILAEERGISLNEFKMNLFYRGKYLKEGNRLSDYNVMAEGGSLHLVCKAPLINKDNLKKLNKEKLEVGRKFYDAVNSYKIKEEIQEEDESIYLNNSEASSYVEVDIELVNVISIDGIDIAADSSITRYY